MALTNPFSITYGSRSVGGSSSTYQLHGPYVIDKSYGTFRLVFDVVVVAASFGGLQSASETLEDSFRKRLFDGESLSIDLDGNAWTYTAGTDILKVHASCTKSGNEVTDRGFSRAYTVTIEGEMPADDSRDDGLRDIEAHVTTNASSRRTVTLRGTYTAGSAGDAKTAYDNGGDDVAQNYLDVVDTQATWELVDESYSMDRESDGSSPTPHLCNWTRQYVELLADQTRSQTDDDQIKDHRITFTDLHQFPGDSREDVGRLRRVAASYDCAVDATATTNLKSVYENKIKDHVRELFRTNFQPSQFGVEEERVAFDHTNNRVSVAVQFIYAPNGGEAIVEVAQALAYREARQIDYTPTHEEDELSYEADIGFATVERVWTRTVIALGEEAPKPRLLRKAAAGVVGKFTDTIGDDSGPDSRDSTKIEGDGWNVVGNMSQATPRWIGDPNADQQIRVTVLTETVTERYHKKPRNGTSASIPRPGRSTG